MIGTFRKIGLGLLWDFSEICRENRSLAAGWSGSSDPKATNSCQTGI